MPFVKIDCGIINSSLWVERDERSVFLTALFMAVPVEMTTPMAQLSVRSLDPTGWIVPPGKYGLVEASGSGILRRDGITDMEAGMVVLEKLGSPDPESRSPGFEGRRLVRVDGGYLVLNYFLYRDRDYTNAERQRRFRERGQAVAESTIPVEIWEAIVAFYGGKCAYCQKTPWVDIDHVIPTSRGGTHTPANVVPACKSCNSAKRNSLPEGRWLLQRRHPFMADNPLPNGVTRYITDAEAEAEAVELPPPPAQARSSLGSTAQVMISIVPAEFRPDMETLLGRLPNLTSWTAEMRAALEGMHGKPITVAQLGQAVRDYLASGKLERSGPSLRSFRRYMQGVTESDPPASVKAEGGLLRAGEIMKLIREYKEPPTPPRQDERFEPTGPGGRFERVGDLILPDAPPPAWRSKLTAKELRVVDAITVERIRGEDRQGFVLSQLARMLSEAQ